MPLRSTHASLDIDMPFWSVATNLNLQLQQSQNDLDAQEGKCVMLVVSSGSYASDSETANLLVFAGGALFKLYYKPTSTLPGGLLNNNIAIQRANVFFLTEFIFVAMHLVAHGPLPGLAK